MRVFESILLVKLLASCQPSSQQPPAVPATTPIAIIPDSPSTDRGILYKNRRFVYLVRWYVSAAAEATLDTVVMTALGEPWVFDSSQTVYEWLYKEDTTRTGIPKEHVGGIERAGKFWLHPPRYERYAILELNPFPGILLPARKGQTWEWDALPWGDEYSDPEWAVWEGTMRVKNRYKTEDSILLDTPLGNLTCQRVQATGTSKLGTTALESYFHPLYGFVRLDYSNINGSRTEMEMLSVDVRPRSESYNKAVEKAFGRTYK